jgi:AcrR family transcriptional regulator
VAVPSERRIPLNRDRVLRAAMALVDKGGIESLSMRKLGQALGVEAMSLYNHVANKDDILDGITDLVWGEIELPSTDVDWETAVRSCAISAHDALIRHRWASNLVMSTTSARPARLRYMEALMARLRRAGFSPEETYHAYHTLDSHILGFTLWQIGHALPEGGPSIRTKEELVMLIARVFPDLSVSDYPYVLEHGELHLSDGSHKDEGEFEFGLRLILDGLRRAHESS